MQITRWVSWHSLFDYFSDMQTILSGAVCVRLSRFQPLLSAAACTLHLYDSTTWLTSAYPVPQLVNYDVNAWEGRAYEYGLAYLRDAGCNVDGMSPFMPDTCLKRNDSRSLQLLRWLWWGAGLTFDPDLVIRGLLIDRKLGNLVKADRFG